MAYLVTGGTGFIGSYVVRDLLNAGKEVVCLQRSGVTPVFRSVVGEDNINQVKIVQGDVSDTAQVFNVIQQYGLDVIVHTACILGASGSTSSETRPTYALQVNCIGMSNLLEAARQFGVRKVVWTSSTQALGRVGEVYKGLVGDDDAIYMPDTMYSATKVLGELMSRLYFEKFGVDSVGFRMGLILGIGKIHGRGEVFTKFMRHAATDLPATMAATDSNKVRALGYVENISELIVKACEAPTTRTRTFNAIEYQVSCSQLVESIRRVNPGSNVTLKDGVPCNEATWGGNPEPMLEYSGVQRELGWKPRYSLDEALTRIFNHFRLQDGLPPLMTSTVGGCNSNGFSAK